MPRGRPLSDLEALLGHSFADPELLNAALRHRSWCAEHPGYEPNERLEFMGDAVLGLVVTERLYEDFPDLAEGELAKARATVVSTVALTDLATSLELGDFILLGKGEDASGGREKASILADTMEAVFAAVFLDGGWEPARRIITDLVGSRIKAAASDPGTTDFKTRLQELAAQQFEQLPRYQVRSEGPDHSRQFFATVRIGGEERGSGEGRSKKQAEQHAAEAAWRTLQSHDRDDNDDASAERDPRGAARDGSTADSDTINREAGSDHAGAT